MEIRQRDEDGCRVYDLEGQLTFRSNGPMMALVAAMPEMAGSKVRLDLSRLAYVDSFGIGLMVQASDEARRNGVELCFSNASGTVERMFELMGMAEVLTLEGHARPMAEPQDARAGLVVSSLSETDGPGLALAGRFTLRTQSAFLPAVDGLLVERNRRCVIDLSGLDFMDSSGLAALMAVNDRARQKGIRLELRNPTPKVKSLLDMAAMDVILAG